MKVGAEDKKKVYWLGALAALAVLLVLRALLGGGEPSPAAATPMANAVPAQPEAANARPARAGKNSPPPLDPTLRADLLKTSEGADYKGSGRNIFEAESAPLPKIEKPKAPVIAQAPPPVNTGPPPPPPIPLKFYGFSNKPGQPRSIFLADGDDIFIGHEGDIVNRRYRIIHIMPTQVEIEDVQNSNRQTIPLSQG